MFRTSRIIGLTLSLFMVYHNSIYANPSFIITPSAVSNGSISPNYPLTVSGGSSIFFTATQNAGYMPSEWQVDGQIAQYGGINFLLNHINANHTVSVSFTPLNLMYAGGANGHVYWSMNGGFNWSSTPNNPNPGQPINSLFATNTTLFASTSTDVVYYSTDNGVSWLFTAPTPDNAAVTSLFVTSSNTLYVSTAKGNLYYSNDLCTWNVLSSPLPGQPIQSIYVVNKSIYAAANGNLYYTPNGTVWAPINTTPDGSVIQSVFVANNLLYINTANGNVFTNTQLTGGGTWSFYAQEVHRLCVSNDGSIINSATQDGYVYSLLTGNELAFLTTTSLNALFCLD